MAGRKVFVAVGATAPVRLAEAVVLFGAKGAMLDGADDVLTALVEDAVVA